MIKESDLEITLSSGRTVHCVFGILGLMTDLTLTAGYDDVVHTRDEEDEWTTEERVEVADMMINRWKRWREGA